jgi:hypothetical protein
VKNNGKTLGKILSPMGKYYSTVLCLRMRLRNRVRVKAENEERLTENEES